MAAVWASRKTEIEMKVKTPKNIVLVKPDKNPVETLRADDGSTWKAKELDSGLVMPVNGRDYDPDVVYPFAEVVAVPDYVREQVDTKEWVSHEMNLAPGDRVITMHMLRDKDLTIEIEGEKCAGLFFWQILGKIEGKTIIPCGQWNFLKPVTIDRPEKEVNGIVKLAKKETTQKFGEVVFPNEELLGLGIEVGDHVMMQGTAKGGKEYTVKVFGETFSVVITHEIIAKVNELIDELQNN